MEEKQKALNGVVASLGTSKFNVPDVSIAEITASPEKYVLLDVRSDEERNVSTIPGSISKADFEADPSKYANKEVVCYCTVGYISAGYTCGYRRQGYTNVKNMGDGALLGYTLQATTAGNATPLVTLQGVKTNEVHTFMPDLAPLAGEGMVAKTFADPGAVLTAANEKFKAELGV